MRVVVGASFTSVTTSVKVSLVLATPSLTVTVTIEEPNWLAAGVAVRVRAPGAVAPVAIRRLPSGRRVWLEDRATIVSPVAEVSGSDTVKPSGSVEVRLRSSHPEFVVDIPPAPRPETAAFASPSAVGEDGDDAEDGDVVRVTVRVPSQVKRRAEELAGSTGRSLNSWIVTALRAATRDEGWAVDLANLVGDLTRNPPGQWGGPGRPGHSRRPGDPGGPGDTNLSGWI